MLVVYPAMSQQAKPALIEVASFGKSQPIGVAVAPATNRLFVSFPHRDPFVYALTEIVNGKPVPFPDKEWNKFIPEQDDTHFVNVQDLYADDKNCLWVLDPKPAGNANSKFKLVKIDLNDNKVKQVYKFDDIDKSKSALNDMCIDNSKQLAYLSDPGQHAIVVLDLKTGKSRVVLKDDKATVAQPGLKLHLDGKDVVDEQGNPFVSNVNGIALTKDNKYFYFRAINQTKLYRIETAYLADSTLTDADLSAKVELVAETGICHGMIADNKGNIYLSDSPDHAIQYVTPDKQVHFLVKDERLIWPDSFGIGNDGYLYLSSSQMNRLPKFNNGQDKVEYPFRVYKVKLP
ncbi:L-dopachrome tautomerase-related protein [Mucilaginibacter pocheonensis]|uniref:Sugar lactone lactonase YvrE n=1 Tax=Mucilaginibacter pocheonensis TaxID=398050 RepID=A0ABU1T9M3_9SPHI|nr:L-dopachrome tautomerase-related protein [Mucilaginibacter pocheonensis]MDR6941535.1 sugar lactone lactonase YvrE [Mucilaginibacter pocheonensis]